MKKLYKGTYYHLINLGVESASQYYISRENNIIRVKDGSIFEMKPKITNGVKQLEATIQGTYDATTKTSRKKIKSYNQIYASVFHKDKKFFAIMEIEGIPTLLNRVEYAKITTPRLDEFRGIAHDSTCAIKQSDLKAVKKLKDNGKSLSRIGDMFNCSPTSVARALKRKIN